MKLRTTTLTVGKKSLQTLQNSLQSMPERNVQQSERKLIVFKCVYVTKLTFPFQWQYLGENNRPTVVGKHIISNKMLLYTSRRIREHSNECGYFDLRNAFDDTDCCIRMQRYKHTIMLEYSPYIEQRHWHQHQ